jgi:hypothetical protein
MSVEQGDGRVTVDAPCRAARAPVLMRISAMFGPPGAFFVPSFAHRLDYRSLALLSVRIAPTTQLSGDFVALV